MYCEQYVVRYNIIWLMGLWAICYQIYLARYVMMWTMCCELFTVSYALWAGCYDLFGLYLICMFPVTYGPSVFCMFAIQCVTYIVHYTYVYVLYCLHGLYPLYCLHSRSVCVLYGLFYVRCLYPLSSSSPHTPHVLPLLPPSCPPSHKAPIRHAQRPAISALYQWYLQRTLPRERAPMWYPLSGSARGDNPYQPQSVLPGACHTNHSPPLRLQGTTSKSPGYVTKVTQCGSRAIGAAAIVASSRAAGRWFSGDVNRVEPWDLVVGEYT